MAHLMAYALNNETFRKMIGTKKYKSETESGKLLYFINKHKLVQSLDYVTGGKTGYTVEAKRTLVTSAMKDNMELIVVTFNCGNDWNVHRNLFDYGYTNYKMLTAIRGQVIKVNDYLYSATPILLEDIKYPVREDEKVTLVLNLLRHPKDKRIIGKVYLMIDGVKVYSVDVYRYY
jgi:D-alanyl-D-alanine carboxypeptidase